MKKLLGSALILLAISATNANASVTSVDIGTDSANNGAWSFSDGTNNISSDISFGASSSYWVAGTSYSVKDSVASTYQGWSDGKLSFNVSNLDSAQNVTVNVTSFGVDDRAALLVNGTVVDYTGITSGRANPGLFQLSAGGSYTSESFNGTGTAPSNTSGTFTLAGSLLHNGINTIDVIMNNTNNGIYGATIRGGGADTASYSLNGNIAYASVAAVPVPGAIWLMISGLIGVLGLNRRKSAAV